MELPPGYILFICRNLDLVCLNHRFIKLLISLFNYYELYQPAWHARVLLYILYFNFFCKIWDNQLTMGERRVS